jgi:hypothetical protein
MISVLDSMSLVRFFLHDGAGVRARANLMFNQNVITVLPTSCLITTYRLVLLALEYVSVKTLGSKLKVDLLLFYPLVNSLLKIWKWEGTVCLDSNSSSLNSGITLSKLVPLEQVQKRIK